MVAESRTANAARKGGGPSGRRKGPEVPMKPGNSGEGRALASGVFVKRERTVSGDEPGNAG